MEVTYTEPGVKGDTASTNSLKPATVDTGATIRVPLFIQTGEKLRVDSRTREYSELPGHIRESASDSPGALSRW